jgi:hypothetical protein
LDDQKMFKYVSGSYWRHMTFPHMLIGHTFFVSMSL